MQILIVTQYFFPENFRINDLAIEFQRRGHTVTVLTGLPNYPRGTFSPGYSLCGPYRERHEGVDVIRCPLVPRGAGGSGRLALNYLSFVVMATLRGLLTCQNNFDVIFIHGASPVMVAIPAIVIKFMIRAPVILWVLDLWPESVSATRAIRSPRVLKWIELMVQFIYRHCERILVQSRAFVPHIEQQGVSPEKILYFPSWAETVYETVGTQPSVSATVRLPEGFRVMFAGNVGAAQDFDTILMAAEHLKLRRDIHWIIIGDGRMLSWVEAEVERRQLADTVHLLGRYPLETMPAFFAQADVLLVTLRQASIFALTIPGKVQSYLASGRPIVGAIDGEGARIIREAGAGVVCPAERPDALADAVVRLAETPKEARELMGRRGAEYYRTHFDRTALLNQLERWLQELVVTQRGSRSSAASDPSLPRERGKLS